MMFTSRALCTIVLHSHRPRDLTNIVYESRVYHVYRNVSVAERSVDLRQLRRIYVVPQSCFVPRRCVRTSTSVTVFPVGADRTVL